MTTVIGTAISMGLMLPATTINHQPLRATILVGIHDLILTNDFIMSEIRTAGARNTCGFASCFILDQDGPAAQLRPPFQDVKSCSDVH